MSRNSNNLNRKSLLAIWRAQTLLKIALALALGVYNQTVRAEDSPFLLQLQSSALSGDLRPVEQMADNLDEATLDELSLTLLRHYRARFSQNTEKYSAGNGSPLANATIAIYRNYWRAALTQSLTPDQAEQKLQRALQDLLREEYPSFQPGEDVFAQLQQALTAQKLGSSVGETPPWRDLYIWTQHENRRFEVELTDGEEAVDVTLIEQALVQGWQHFASLDLNATSGWATPNGLYCLCWSYDLTSEAFRVHWLKHETRHLVDFKEFPGLSETEMEYRAKLTELAFAGNQVSGTLRQFANNGLADSTSAHSSANYRVSQDIYREIFKQDMDGQGQLLDLFPVSPSPWTLLGPDRVAPAAVSLLQRDTERLRRAAIQGPEDSQ